MHCGNSNRIHLEIEINILQYFYDECVLQHSNDAGCAALLPYRVRFWQIQLFFKSHFFCISNSPSINPSNLIKDKGRQSVFFMLLVVSWILKNRNTLKALAANLLNSLRSIVLIFRLIVLGILRTYWFYLGIVEIKIRCLFNKSI